MTETIREALMTLLDFMDDYCVNSIVGDQNKDYESGFKRAMDFVENHIKDVYPK